MSISFAVSLARKLTANGVSVVNNLNTVYNISLKKNEISNLFLLALLNSFFLRFIFNLKFSSDEKIFPYIRIEQLKQLPIPKISITKQKPFIRKAEKLIELNIKLHKAKNSFLNLLQTKLKITKISKKLNTWYELSLNEFEKELTKAKVKLSLKKEKEWQEFFVNEQKEIKPILTEISKTDKQIDRMVYKLYDLTKEEIKLVENF